LSFGQLRLIGPIGTLPSYPAPCLKASGRAGRMPFFVQRLLALIVKEPVVEQPRSLAMQEDVLVALDDVPARLAGLALLVHDLFELFTVLAVVI
jgi:hypothetical protein